MILKAHIDFFTEEDQSKIGAVDLKLNLNDEIKSKADDRDAYSSKFPLPLIITMFDLAANVLGMDLLGKFADLKNVRESKPKDPAPENQGK